MQETSFVSQHEIEACCCHVSTYDFIILSEHVQDDPASANRDECTIASNASYHRRMSVLTKSAIHVFWVFEQIATWNVLDNLADKFWLLLLQATTPVAMSMFQMMLRVHSVRGEGLQAVALLKSMRAAGLTLTPSVCSLMVQAFCRAGALQVRNGSVKFLFGSDMAMRFKG